eukprot:5709698-Pyramimonas_sp.AAC.1
MLQEDHVALPSDRMNQPGIGLELTKTHETPLGWGAFAIIWEFTLVDRRGLKTVPRDQSRTSCQGLGRVGRIGSGRVGSGRVTDCARSRGGLEGV